jgi:hypothetical protein
MNDIQRSIEQSKNITQEDLDRLRVNCYRMIFKEIEKRNISIDSVVLENGSKEDMLKEYKKYLDENKI